MSSKRLSKALALLKARQFKPVNSSTKVRKFSGALNCKKGAVKIMISISDWDFITYPVITITERPSFFPRLMPHLMNNDQLCYFSDNVILDRYAPDIAIAQCLNQAEQLINEITTDEEVAKADVQEEFLNYWVYGQEKISSPTIFGEIENGSESADYFLLQRAEVKY